MQLVTTNTPLTMSSLKIAELTGKEHRNVIRDIRKMLTDIHGEKDALSFEHIYPDAYGRKQPCFQLDEAHTATLLTGYDAKARFAVTSEWLEMKKAPPQINLDDPAALRPLLLSYTEKVIELQEVVAEQAPKVAALERMSAAEGSLVPREAAKCVGTTQTKLYDWLLEHKWCYRAASNNDRPGPLRAYATRVANGDLEERNVSAGFTRDGVDQVKPQVYITIKGQTKIAKLLSGEVEQVFDSHIPLPEPVTLKELHLAALEAAMAVGPDRVRSVIAGFGAPKIAEVAPSKRDVLLAALKRAVSEPF